MSFFFCVHMSHLSIMHVCIVNDASCGPYDQAIKSILFYSYAVLLLSIISIIDIYCLQQCTVYYINHNCCIYVELTCPRCDSGEVEDEKHCRFNCNSLILQQSKLLSCIDANCTQFKTLDNKNKLISLMNSENKDVLLELCNFVKNNEKHTQY